MRRIAHLSDLHFGAEEPAMVEALAAALATLAPDVIVISGDLTQRGRREQFRAADRFLRRLEAGGSPVVLVPGNHDIPLYNLARRFLSPLRRWQRHAAAGRRERYFDDEIAIVGLNTARSLAFKGGRLSTGQLNALSQNFATASPGAMRLLVTHHPLVALRGHGRRGRTAHRDAHALAAIRAAHVRLLLAGHLHHPGVERGPSDLAHPAADPRTLVIQAGTATSWRRRGSPNSFNLLRLDGGTLAVDLIEADGGAPFARRLTCSYSFSDDGGWRVRA
jgi:3',5'-cyclic AMP phosphodiesterase CpdA